MAREILIKLYKYILATLIRVMSAWLTLDLGIAELKQMDGGLEFELVNINKQD